MREDCRNLRHAKGKAYNATHNKSEEEETLDKDQKYLTIVAPHEEFEGSQSYYLESSDKEREELKEAYGLLQETNQKNVKELNNLKMEKGTLLQKIIDLEDKLMEV
jgi:Mor family transcriptional regulator